MSKLGVIVHNTLKLIPVHMERAKKKQFHIANVFIIFAFFTVKFRVFLVNFFKGINYATQKLQYICLNTTNIS